MSFSDHAIAEFLDTITMMVRYAVAGDVAAAQHFAREASFILGQIDRSVSSL